MLMCRSILEISVDAITRVVPIPAIECRHRIVCGLMIAVVEPSHRSATIARSSNSKSPVSSGKINGASSAICSHRAPVQISRNAVTADGE
jgi:hypothetical protein